MLSAIIYATVTVYLCVGLRKFLIYMMNRKAQRRFMAKQSISFRQFVLDAAIVSACWPLWNLRAIWIRRRQKVT